MLRLKALRLLSERNQSDICEATQIHRVDLVHLEQGRLTPTPDQAARLAKVLGCPVERLFDHVDERNLGVGSGVEARAAQREEKSRAAR